MTESLAHQRQFPDGFLRVMSDIALLRNFYSLWLHSSSWHYPRTLVRVFVASQTYLACQERRVCKKEILASVEAGLLRVLDLGCGSGRDLASWGVTAADEVTGLDIDDSRLTIAKSRFPKRTYLHGAGECLPFADERFDRVVSSVALPYMNIQKTLAEIYRVLVPGGGLSLSLHLPSFTIAEFLHDAIPKPLPTLFRLYVMANGLVFHCTGRTIGFVVGGRTESFQTERGMRVALNRAGFVNPSFSRATGPVGETFIVETRTSKAIGTFAIARGAAAGKD
jgi:ubiquinone/menaquinone biosynthesis C-methylase UbiE